jgi:xanthine dehydrogenase accessory factor
VRDIERDVRALLAAGTPFALATVTATWSSAPRAPGATMAVTADGVVVGSVSGGCVEAALHEVALDVLAGKVPAHVERYGVSDELALGAGLTCGGTLEVFVEEIDDPAAVRWQQVLDCVDEREPVALATIIRSTDDRVGQSMLITATTFDGTLGTEGLDVAVLSDARGMLNLGRTGVLRVGPNGERRMDDVSVFVRVLAPAPRMLVFGAIDFAAAVASVGSFLGYRVTVCDARPVFATQARFPEADEVVVDWPHRYLASQTIEPSTVVCVLTHDPKFDVPLLELALRTPACYIGAMGSRRTHADRLDRLRERGLTDEELARLSSPIGLDLGASTPQETAVAIAAEIIALRHGSSGRRLTQTSGPLHVERPVGEASPASAAG